MEHEKEKLRFNEDALEGRRQELERIHREERARVFDRGIDNPSLTQRQQNQWTEAARQEGVWDTGELFTDQETPNESTE